MKLVVGIGNPGPRYEGTRHNVGFEVVELLAARGGASFRSGRCQADEAGISLAGEKVLLARPTTYVNGTGTAVASLLSWYDLEPSALLVVVDCVDLEVGTLRLKARGSSAGHKGVQSILEALGTDGFARLRLGVTSSIPDVKSRSGGTAPRAARPQGGGLSGHVLGRFSREERPIVDEVIRRAADAASDWVAEDIEVVMSRVNKRKD